MRDVLIVLLGVCLAAVAATLATGFFALFKGGQFGRTWSNRLMRLRVALQFTAILVLAAVFWLSQHGR
ncbi:MAG TPA: twin transmembrane helix small protein [Caulobacteraceae bacterium]|nr:twin transmembrane helix small protein [Caulobacteraceae bacterium]